MRAKGPALNVVIVTLDMHLSQVAAQVAANLQDEMPGLALSFHAAAEWDSNPAALARCRDDIASAHIVVANMFFLEEQIRAILPALEARREACDAMVITMSAPEMVRLTKIGGFRMDAPESGTLALLKKLRGSSKPGAAGKRSGAGQMAMLRRLPKILRMIPGKAQDVRAYFLAMQYWLAGSDANIANMVRFLVNRYADGERRILRGTLSVAAPIEYPDVGVYHPRLEGGISDRLDRLPGIGSQTVGTVGILVLRSYVLAEDTAHYDGVIASLEARGLRVIPAFASGLDARPAIEKFFCAKGRPNVDLILSLTGFSLVGGPAYNDAAAAEEILAEMDVAYIAAQPVEFQTLESWSASASGLTPVEATIMVALPELDGAVSSMIFGGRSDGSGCASCKRNCGTFARRKIEPSKGVRQMQPCLERADMLADRIARLVALRRTARLDKKLAVVLFNFPPNAGAAGSAAYLSVFASLFNVLTSLKAGGYGVELPSSVEALRERLLQGNSQTFGTDANIHTRIPVDDHIRREPHLAAIEKAWGPAPGRQLTNGDSLFVLGARFGNIFVGLQPGFGYEGDPMRMLFEGSFAPTHAFSAFYRYIREDFGAHAVLHFGTHGALEFMPGKQVGMSETCWPDRLIGALPNFYFYAANNPSEGAIAKRRAASTLISYLTPAVARAGLYRGLSDLKASIDQWRPGDTELLAVIKDQSELLALDVDADSWRDDPDAAVNKLALLLYEYEQTLIPEGLHVIGEPMGLEARIDTLLAMAAAHQAVQLPRATIEALVGGKGPREAARLSGLPESAETADLFQTLETAARHLAQDSEIPALLSALDARYIHPVAGGDLIRSAAILPTGRNLHGFDPFALPSATALRKGTAQAQTLLDRHAETGAPLPETIAFVLWGTDNLKNDGERSPKCWL